MREIKFRAWLPKQKMFFYWGFNLRDDGAFFDSPPSVKDSVQQQYTGLKDKNGKEIYEGDLMWTSKYSDSPRVVRWNNEESRFELGLMDNNEPDKAYLMTFGTHLEVIGNIYENPELLEVANGKHEK